MGQAEEEQKYKISFKSFGKDCTYPHEQTTMDGKPSVTYQDRYLPTKSYLPSIIFKSKNIRFLSRVLARIVLTHMNKLQ